MICKIEKKVNSDISKVKNIVDDILLNIQESLSDNMFFNTKLILNELIINGIMHGNMEDENKMLDIDIFLDNSCLVIEVSDEGSGIVYKRKEYGQFDFDESGRGLMLVECLSDKFDIRGNKVTCIQYIK
jgi:serine/threonine-protein kinase RsbW